MELHVAQSQPIFGVRRSRICLERSSELKTGLVIFMLIEVLLAGLKVSVSDRCRIAIATTKNGEAQCRYQTYDS
jgi:hypothetical protein